MAIEEALNPVCVFEGMDDGVKKGKVRIWAAKPGLALTIQKRKKWRDFQPGRTEKQVIS